MYRYTVNIDYSCNSSLAYVRAKRMPFGLANSGSVYSRMLDVAMKEVERDFWTSYLDDILTFSTGPGIHFGHLSQVVLAHVAADIKIQPCKSM